MDPRDLSRPSRSAAPPSAQAPPRADARQIPAEEHLTANPARLAEGWERRFVIEGARLSAYVELYESMGLEVITEPVGADGAMLECTDCQIAALLQFSMIYTRARRVDLPSASPSATTL
jgi:hypothetical protein